MEIDRTLDTNGWPERYFAVIFTAQRSLSGDDIYDMTADRMVLLAQRQPGFLGVESVRGDGGIGITVSYWVDRSAIANWEAKNTGVSPEDSDLIVREVKVDSARMLKRLQTAPQGRAHRIRKRSNHVTIIVDSVKS